MNLLKQEIDNTYAEAIKTADEQIKYYQSKMGKIRNWSKNVRFIAIVLFGISGIFPLIDKNLSKWEVDISNWGYVMIAIAGTLLLLDKFFGYSTAWMRCITAELEIGKIMKEFKARWQIENLRLAKPDDLTPEEAITFLIAIKDFTGQVDEIVKQETLSWVTEFQSNMAELHKMTNTKLETLKPGSINVSIKSPDSYAKLSLKVDGLERRKDVVNAMLIDNISPGSHEIKLTTILKSDGTENSTIFVVEVEPNKMSTVNF